MFWVVIGVCALNVAAAALQGVLFVMGLGFGHILFGVTNLALAVVMGILARDA